jgi:hypothetical protein
MTPRAAPRRLTAKSVAVKPNRATRYWSSASGG